MARQFLDKRGWQQDGKCTVTSAGSSSRKSSNKVTPSKVQKRKEQMAQLWVKWGSSRKKKMDLEDFECLKAFVKHVASNTPGRHTSGKPSFNTIKLFWEQFTCRMEERGNKIPDYLREGVAQYIREDLLEEGVILDRTRHRRHASPFVLGRIAEQLWVNDWEFFRVAATRVHFWSYCLLTVLSGARAGELVESSSRKGSGRCLRFKDIQLYVIRNERGTSELSLQYQRYVKGNRLGCERPETLIHEGLESYNSTLMMHPMLFFASIILSRDALRDYHSIDELLRVEAPHSGLAKVLHWSEGIMDQPVYLVGSSPDQYMTADFVMKRLRSLGFGAGFTAPPTIHDFRAETLTKASRYYNEAQIMTMAGHRNRDILPRHYYGTNPGVDVQGIFEGAVPADLRSHVADTIRSSRYYEIQPDLIQSPLARDISNVSVVRNHHRNHRPEKIRGRVGVGVGGVDEQSSLSPTTIRQRQENGQVRPQDPIRSTFHRVRAHTPERDRLAKLLPLTTKNRSSLRSEEGIEAMRNLVALCRRGPEVDSHPPGLRPDLYCRCSRGEGGGGGGGCCSSWSDVLKCYRGFLRRQGSSGSGEYCFLCNRWIEEEEEDNCSSWRRHLAGHLKEFQKKEPENNNNNNNPPLLCNPIVVNQVPVVPGLCPICITDEKLEMEDRLRQWTYLPSWRRHVEGCVGRYEEKKLGLIGAGEDTAAAAETEIKCPFFHCSAVCKVVLSASSSASDFSHHIHDSHAPGFLVPSENRTKAAAREEKEKKKRQSLEDLEDRILEEETREYKRSKRGEEVSSFSPDVVEVDEEIPSSPSWPRSCYSSSPPPFPARTLLLDNDDVQRSRSLSREDQLREFKSGLRGGCGGGFRRVPY